LSLEIIKFLLSVLEGLKAVAFLLQSSVFPALF
jgi:hypothetical protein